MTARLVLLILCVLTLTAPAFGQVDTSIPDMSEHGFRFVGVGKYGEFWERQNSCIPSNMTFCAQQKRADIAVNLIFKERYEKDFTLEKQKAYARRLHERAVAPLIRKAQGEHRMVGEGFGELGSGQPVAFYLETFTLSEEDSDEYSCLFMAAFAFQTPTKEIFTGYVAGSYDQELPHELVREGLAQIHLVDPHAK